MYKVIIADDDFLVRTYLKQMIDWESHGFTIVGDAKNGKEALKLIERERPALVITDICMPVLDGIGLIREMRSRNLPGHILVLSGHDDFAYVHEAMKLGIDDYLLKDDLTPENILSFLQEHLQMAAQDQAGPVPQEELRKLGEEKLRDDFLAVFQQSDLAEAELMRAAERAGIPKSFRFAAAARMTLRGFLPRFRQFSPDERASFQQAFSEMCQTFLSHQQPDCLGQSFSIRPELGIWGLLMFFPHEVSRAAVLQRLQAMGQKLQVLIRRYFDLQVVIILTSPQSGLPLLQRAWQAAAAREEAVFYLSHGIHPVEDLPELRTTAPFSVDLPADELCRNLEQIPLTRQARRAVVRGCLSGQDEAALAAIDEAETLPSFLEALRRALDGARAAGRIHPSVRHALALIETHYRENLTQAEVAAAVHLNPAYFSTLFKKNMGKGFREYLADCRIKAVKQRLCGSTERIKDIAAAEGFDDYPYFCRLFKNLVGQTPQEYRLSQNPPAPPKSNGIEI